MDESTHGDGADQPFDSTDVSNTQAPASTSGLAVAALVLGIVSLCLPPLGVIGIALGIAALVHVSRGNRQGMALAIVGIALSTLFLVVGMALIGIGVYMLTSRTMVGATQIRDIIARENQYQQARVTYLADYLTKAHPDARYLLITNQRTEFNEDRQQAMMNALKPLNIAQIHEVMPPEEMGDEMMPEADLFLTAEMFDKIIERYSDCDMVISTLGLPMDYRDMKLWTMAPEKRPRLVLLDAYVYDLRKAIEKGAIAAVVQYRPDAEYRPDEDVPDNTAEAFAKRYILITPENVDEMDKTYPGLFMEEEKK